MVRALALAVLAAFVSTPLHARADEPEAGARTPDRIEVMASVPPPDRYAPVTWTTPDGARTKMHVYSDEQVHRIEKALREKDGAIDDLVKKLSVKCVEEAKPAWRLPVIVGFVGGLVVGGIATYYVTR